MTMIHNISVEMQTNGRVVFRNHKGSYVIITPEDKQVINKRGKCWFVEYKIADGYSHSISRFTGAKKVLGEAFADTFEIGDEDFDEVRFNNGTLSISDVCEMLKSYDSRYTNEVFGLGCDRIIARISNERTFTEFVIRKSDVKDFDTWHQCAERRMSFLGIDAGNFEVVSLSTIE